MIAERTRPISSQVQTFSFGGQLPEGGPFTTLGDLDQCKVSIHVTEPLFGQIARIRLQANTYELGVLDASDFYRFEPGSALEFPLPLSDTEQGLPWAGILPSSHLRQPNAP